MFASIIKKGTQYIGAIKGNEKTVSEEVKEAFRFLKSIETATDIDLGYESIETRKGSAIAKFINNTDNQWNQPH